jgi:hypothetical protein
MPPLLRAGLLAVVSSFLLGACAARGTPAPALVERDVPLPESLSERSVRSLSEDGNAYVLGADPAHPRVRYLDGQLSLNETCAIRVENKLSRKIPPVYVNGQPIGFC